LGGEATAIFPSGGYTGKYFNQLLEQDKINSVIIEAEKETRENFIVLEESTNNQYRFGMPGTELKENEWEQCLSAVEKIDDVEYIVASGSLPPGVPIDIYAKLAFIAKQKKAKFIVDTSGDALKQAMEEGVYLMKPNVNELCGLSNKKELKMEEISIIANKIIASGKCEVMVVSMGASGAMLITNSITELITPPSVVRKSSVGAGDSMVAGIVHFLLAGRNLEEAVRFGVACGTAATMNPGTELCNKETADRLFKLLSVQPITTTVENI
jgi:6-phosphofructokinase 2